MNQYPECESCRFADDCDGPCDICDDGDMFEPLDEEAFEVISLRVAA